MQALIVAGAALAVVAPLAALGLFVRQRPRLAQQAPLLVSVLATGVVGAVFAAVVERVVQRTVELDPFARNGSVTLLFYTFSVSAPLEMALAVAVVAPFWRIRRSRRSERWSQRPTDREGMVFAACSAAGHATMRHALVAWRAETGLDLVRLLFAGFGFLFLASLWGYTLGRDSDRGLRAKNLALVWLGATVFLAVQDELLFHRGRQALLASLPLLACVVGTAAFLWRDPVPSVESEASGRLSTFLSAPAPSLGAIREAFRHEDRPLTLRWMTLGVFVNAGVVLVGLVVAVALGRRFGVDFAAVDRPEATNEAVGPVALLALGALAAFPVAGYLIARASGSRSVLEPALSSALAMVALLVFFGLLAPTALVFVMAVTPIAFGLSCAGAWFGTAR